MKKNGFTLIEMVIAIVVISIAFYSIISVFMSLSPKNVNMEDFTKAANLSNRVMEETLTKNYADIVSQPAANFSAPFQNFRYLINVTNVSTADLNVPDDSPFKKVDVFVWGGLGATVEMTTVVATYGL